MTPRWTLLLLCACAAQTPKGSGPGSGDSDGGAAEGGEGAADGGEGATDGGDSAVPPGAWQSELAPLSELEGGSRGLRPRRAIVHLHSAWSHDACDGEPLPDGIPDANCVSDLREALCAAHVDDAFLTDHPAHAADQSWEALFHAGAADAWVEDEEGHKVASQIHCEDGFVVTWRHGIEDEQMPVGLDQPAAETAEERYAIYGSLEAEALAASRAAGGVALMAHTEQHSPEEMVGRMADGLQGFEIFNLHAAFDPDIRRDYLGLEAGSWLADIAPFTSPDGTAEPDLFVLAVLQDQTPSLAAFDAALAAGPVVGTAGTDAHQNVLPLPLRDGERGDSYRRMIRWFSNHILVEEGDEDPLRAEAALAAGRSYVAFEILGTPVGVDLALEGADGQVYELGSDAPPGTLVVGCPSLAEGSPVDGETPDITVTVLKDGLPWQTGCGRFEADGPAVYRLAVDITPWHLRGFLGDDPEPWLKSYPWVRTNAIRVLPE